MGNALSLKTLFGTPTNQEDSADSVSHHSVSALAHHLAHFQMTSQVPEGLSEHVASSKKTQAKWYSQLLLAWKEANPPPKTRKQASKLVIQTLKQDNVEGLLMFYGLPLPNDMVGILEEIAFPHTWPEGVMFDLQTLPVDARAVADGDGLTVYVDIGRAMYLGKYIWQFINDLELVHAGIIIRQMDFAARLLPLVTVQNGSNNEDVLAKKYRIRLRGIDAPENQMPYGLEAKEELTKLVQGKCLIVHVYGEDQYGRLVGDVYFNGTFAQEIMLKKGLAWHYRAYDKRPEFIEWEREARAARVGLWASTNPEKPWEWRRNNRRGRSITELMIELLKLMAGHLFRGIANTLTNVNISFASVLALTLTFLICFLFGYYLS